MTSIKLALATLLFAFTNAAYSQIEGDTIFATDQVMTIELNFSQTGYWDSLVDNYATETYMSADLVITTIHGTRSFPNVGVRFKGNSTYNHPNDKKPFKIDFNRYNDDQNFDGIKKLNLSNGFKDPSCMREKLFFDFCRTAGINAPRANFANLYINGTLWGFYTVVEQIDDQFLDWAIMDDDGNLFKAGDNFGGGPGGSGTPADLVYYGSASTDYADRYELKTNEDVNDWTDFIELLDYINNSTDTDFQNNIDTYFEKFDLFRAFAIDNLFGNLDSYTGSARNYYLYHNMTTGRWEWVKWDGNEAFGSYTNGQVTNTLNVEYHNSDRPLLERIIDNPYFNTDYKNELCDLIDTYFNNAYMDAKIDELYALIQNHVYADNNKMYSDSEFDTNIASDVTSGGPGPGGGGSIYGLKSFITTRVNSVTTQIDCNYYNDLNEAETDPILMYPNPASDEVTLELTPETERVEVRSITGQLVFFEELSGNNTSVQLSVREFSNGTYYVSVLTADEMYTEKLIVQD
jgi:spore coat protein CotH